ncbi:uncharacterized protein LOC129616994 [Condylostylus longicornis]|uniref:uncharacterized protein LOC129616994 n=1 Tax=Condylostylus longicornis TaxID=2530218 RepID=UPI00244E19DF|nr:uncharacterized protein LOC129616994 [Condylostylus longicornis]
MTSDGRPAWLKAVQPFALGGLAGCVATTIIQPVDMVKVRIQLAGEGGAAAVRGPFAIAGGIIKNEGFFSLYKGLDAGLIRQITYTTARMGLFRVITDAMKKPEESVPLHKKAFAGLAAGGLASVVGNPADLSLIRLQADATLPPEARRNYKGAVDALTRIAKEEGICGWWRGCTPTVARAMALNMGMLASFDQSKEMLEKRFGPGWGATLTASAISGWFAVTFSLPFDFIKTRIQKMKADPITGELPYKNMVDCASKTFRAGGPTAFYAGYLTYYFRVAPHVMITLVFLDCTNKAVAQFYRK